MIEKKKILIGIILFIVIITLIGAGSRSGDTSAEEVVELVNDDVNPPIVEDEPETQQVDSTPSEEYSPEYMLASLDAGYFIAEDDVSVYRIGYLLDELENKTKNTRSEIGDMTVSAQELLKTKYGKEMTIQQILEGVNESLPDDPEYEGIFDYAEMVSVYLVLVGTA